MNLAMAHDTASVPVMPEMWPRVRAVGKALTRKLSESAKRTKPTMRVAAYML
jgi:hypothetical protein